MFIHLILIDIIYIYVLERVPILHDFSALPLTSASTWRWRKFTSWLWYYCTGLLPRSWLDIICDVRGAQKLGDLPPRMELVTFCPGLKGTEPSRDRGKHVKLSTQHFSSSRAYFQEDGWLVTEYVCLILTGATLQGFACWVPRAESHKIDRSTAMDRGTLIIIIIIIIIITSLT